MASSILMKFPFTIDGKERTSIIETEIEREMACISFALPFDLELSIPMAKLMLKKKTHGSLYVFEFVSLDEALEWVENPELNVEYGLRNGNALRIEHEMNEFMKKYEQNEKRPAKRLVEDADGYKYYRRN
ncbi:hypothetical protein ENBRE01_0288 [Enteropsectra breve]|nr:hypothetical protein ENBRE01_0288 [Enteropsectra breve]